MTTSLKTNRSSTTVTADYNLGGGTIKEATIDVRLLKAILSPTASEGLSRTVATGKSRVKGTIDNDTSNTTIDQFLRE